MNKVTVNLWVFKKKTELRSMIRWENNKVISKSFLNTLEIKYIKVLQFLT